MGADIQFWLEYAANRQAHISDFLQLAPERADRLDEEYVIRLTTEGHLKHKLMISKIH